MAEIIDNEKNFMVIKVSLPEVESWGGLGICDYCNSPSTSQFYIAVLNACYCDACYAEWLQRAINYHEDQPYEEMAFNRMKKFLKL